MPVDFAPQKVETEIRDVTPVEAAEWLARQNPLRGGQRHIKAYARDMAAGQWRLNGETIVFSTDGMLLDGRKRLRACIEANVPFRTVVVRNVPAGAFETIDALRARKAADILYIRKEAHHRTLAAVLNLVYRYYHKTVHSIGSATARDTLFVLDVRPEIRESVDKTKALGRIGWHTITATAHHLASRVDPDRADAFFTRVATGGNGKTDPATLLRNQLEASVGSGQERMLALAILAWNAEYQGKPLGVLRWRQDTDTPDRFPSVMDLPEADGADLREARTLPETEPVDETLLSVSLEFVTPQKAQEYWNANTNNRKLVMGVVNKYARDMESGHWMLNGQTLKFSTEGRLLDGQHRCVAAVKAGRGFYAIIVRGLPETAFETLDAGPVRSLGEVLSARGEKNTFTLAAALQKIWVYQQGLGMLRDVRGSHAELLRVLDEQPAIRDCVNFAITKLRGVIPGGIGTATHYLGSRFDRKMADEFVERLGDGVGLGRNDPVRLLREQLLRDRKNRRTSMGEIDKWAITIKAMNAFFEGAEVKLLVWRPGAGESFPRVVGEGVLERAA